jgi:hypothetical protein
VRKGRDRCRFCSDPIQIGNDIFYFTMTVTAKLLAGVLVVLAIAASHANAGQFRGRGTSGYGHTAWKYRYTAPRFYAWQRPDLGAAVAAALADAALQLIPRATEALAAKLPPPASPPAPPTVTAQRDGSPPSSDVLDDIEGNSRGITRQEVEAALTDWCATHADAPLCLKLQVSPPPPGHAPTYAPPPQPYQSGYGGGRGYYRPGRFQTWNGCQTGWTVQDGLCKPYRGY